METIYRNSENLDAFTLLLMASVLIFAMAKAYDHSRFYTFLWLPFNNRYIGFYGKRGKLKNPFHILVFIFQIINTATFAYFAFSMVGGMYFLDGPVYILAIAAILLIFLGVKALLQLGVGFVFDLGAMALEFIYNKQSYYNSSGLVLCIANCLILYVSKESETIIYVAIFAFLVVNGMGFVNLLRIYQKQIARNIVYFILYFCALEIAPLAILANYLKG